MANYNIDAIYNGNTSLPGTERVRIDSSGNIGIGTATPSTKLHIYENANRVTYISQNDNHTARFEAYGTATAIDTTASNGIFFRINSGDIVKFAADGNVGIGTSTARAPLDIYRASNPFIRVNGGGAYSYIQMDDGTSTGYLIKNTSSGTSNGALAGAMYTYTDSSKAFQHIHSGTPLFTILSGGNVGIGTTAPNDKLDVVGRVYAYRYIAVSSNAASPAYATDTNTGMFNAGSNIIGFSISSAEKVRIDAGGNLGVGITSLVHKIQAAGLISAGDATYNNNSTFIGAILNNDQTNPGLDLRRWNGGGAGTDNHGATYIATNSAGDTLFYNGLIAANTRATNEKMRISVAGNVGIGTTSPNRKLVVYGDGTLLSLQSPTASSYSEMEFTAQGVGAAYIFKASAGFTSYAGAGSFNFYNAGSFGFHTSVTNNAIHIIAAGNVGIGTTSPAYKLDVNGSIALSGYRFADFNTYYTRIFEPSGNTAIYLGNASDPTNYSDNTNHAFRNRGGSSVYAYINSNGNLGLGTTGPAYKLHIVGDEYVTGNITIGLTSNYSNLNFIRNGGSAVGGVGWRSDGYFYVAGHPDYGPGAGNDVRVRGFGGNLILGTNSTDYVYLNTSGNVGIGTTTVRATLHVNGDFIRDSNLPYSWGTSAPFRTFSGAYSYSNGGVNGPTRFLLLWPQITTTNGQNGRFVNAKLTVSRGATHAYNDTTIGDIVASAGYNSSANLYSYTPLIGAQLYFYNVVYNSVTYLAISLPISDFRWELSGHYGIEETAYYSPTFVYSNTSGVGTITQLTDYTNESVAIYNKGGNIGINTTSPASKLEVKGADNAAITAIFQSTSGGNAAYNGGIQLGNAASSQNSQIYHDSSGDNTLTFVSNYGSGTGNKFIFSPGGTERVRFQQNGKVGIGTTNPVAKLSVYTTSPHASPTGISVAAGAGGANLLAIDSGSYHNWFPYVDGLNYYSADGHVFRSSNHLTNYVNINSNGNVGIGTTSPTQRLHVLTTGGSTTAPNIVTTFQANTATTILAGGGTAIKFVGVSSGGNLQDYDQGMISTLGYADNNRHGMQFWVKPNASTVLTVGQTIDSNGNVGIGTTSPAYKLDVSGTARVGDVFLVTTATTSDARIEVGSGRSGNGNSYVDLVGDATYTDYGLRLIRSNGGANTTSAIAHRGTGTLYITAVEAAAISLETTNTTRMTIAPGGYIGIGTSSPTAYLHIYGQSGDTANIRLKSSNGRTFDIGSTGTSYGSANNFIIYDVDAVAERLRINSDGNVGIGTTSPITKLHVAGTTSIIPTYDSGSGYSYFLRMGYDTSGSYDYTIKRNGSTGFLEFNGTQGSTYVSYVFAGGDVYSGASGGTIGGFYFNSSSHGIRRATGTNDVYCFTTTGTLYLGAGGSSTTHVRVLSGGDVGIGVSPSYKLDVNGNIHGTGFPTSSDVRFKKNITPLQNSLEKIKKLQGVKYEWNEFVNSRRDGYKLNIPIIGLIAQDVEQVVPEIVDHWKLSEDCQDARSIDYPRLIPLLIEAMKEQQNQIEELRNEIKSLKSN